MKSEREVSASLHAKKTEVGKEGRTGVVNSVRQSLPVPLPSKANVETLLGVAKCSDGKVSLRGHHRGDVLWASNVAQSGAVVKELCVGFFCEVVEKKRKGG